MRKLILKALKIWLSLRGREWFALSVEDNTEINGAVYHLNPWDQAANNYGWFTAWELFLWGFNLGSVPKKG